MHQKLKSSVRVIGVPFRLGGNAQRSSVHKAPETLIAAGLLRSIAATGRRVHYEDLGVLLKPEPPHKDDDIVHHALHVRDTICRVYVEVLRCLKTAFPLVLGGDHSIAAGSLLAALHHYKDDLRVVYFDQHFDANTAEESPSKNAHGMPLRLAFGEGDPRLLIDRDRKRYLKPEQVLHVGAYMKHVDPGELAFFERLGIRYISLDEIKRFGIESACAALGDFVADHAVWLSVDIDVTRAPGTGLPLPCGFTKQRMIELLHVTAKRGHIVGMDVVEYDTKNDLPDEHGGFVTINYIDAIIQAALV